MVLLHWSNVHLGTVDLKKILKTKYDFVTLSNVCTYNETNFSCCLLESNFIKLSWAVNLTKMKFDIDFMQSTKIIEILKLSVIFFNIFKNHSDLVIDHSFRNWYQSYFWKTNIKTNTLVNFQTFNFMDQLDNEIHENWYSTNIGETTVIDF